MWRLASNHQVLLIAIPIVRQFTTRDRTIRAKRAAQFLLHEGAWSELGWEIIFSQYDIHKTAIRPRPPKACGSSLTDKFLERSTKLWLDASSVYVWLFLSLKCWSLYFTAIASSFRMIAAAALAWSVLNLLDVQNPLTPFLFISYPLPLEKKDDQRQRFGKGYLDLAFLAFYVIVFSFVRQFAVFQIVKPLAIKGGISGERRIERFTEQGYAFLYWSTSSIIGLASGMTVNPYSVFLFLSLDSDCHV